MILENKTAKILYFDNPQKLHLSKICVSIVYPYITLYTVVGDDSFTLWL